MSDAEITVKRSHCNRCGRDTKQDVLFKKDSTAEVFFDGAQGFVDICYLVLQCRGCEEISFKRSVWLSEIEDVIEEDYFPPRISRKKPSWFSRLPDDYKLLMQEIYSSLYGDNRQLALMGTRALFDRLIMRKVGDCGTFAAGLEALEEQAYISGKNKAVIQSAIDAGHAAAHRDYRPSSQTVNEVMDIVENVIQHDLLEISAENLRKSTPPRAPRKKTK